MKKQNKTKQKTKNSYPRTSLWVFSVGPYKLFAKWKILACYPWTPVLFMLCVSTDTFDNKLVLKSAEWS